MNSRVGDRLGKIADLVINKEFVEFCSKGGEGQLRMQLMRLSERVLWCRRRWLLFEGPGKILGSSGSRYASGVRDVPVQIVESSRDGRRRRWLVGW